MEKKIQQTDPAAKMNEDVPAVFVVEDDLGLNLLIRKTLEREGFKTHQAVNGAEAITAAATLQYSLMLLDYCLPDMTGKQIILALSKKEIFAPIIVMTGNGDERIAVETMKLGVRDYIIKEPDFIARLPKIINRIIDEITKEKELARMEKVLRESEAKYRELYESMIDAFVMVDMDGKILEFNRVYCDMLGYSAEEIRGLTYSDLTPEKWHAFEKQIVENQIVHNGFSDVYEKEYRRKDGTVFPVELRTVLLKDSNGAAVGMWGIVRDITERKRAEIILRDEKDRIQTIMDLVGDPIFVKDNDHRITFANSAFYAMFDTDEKSVLGKTLAEAVPENERHHFLAVDRSVLDTGIPDLREEKLTVKNFTRTILTRKTRFVDVSGNRFMVGSIHDITERKQAEEKQKNLEEQLRQSQKLEAIGQLSSGVAHDFNNLLGGIMGHAELLKMNLNPASPILKHSEVIISLCQKAASLTKQLLSFARKAPFELQKFDMNAFINQVAGLMERTIDRRVEIVVEVPAQPAFISGDRNQLENALLNIAINARDAMPDGGCLTITSETVAMDQAEIQDEHIEAMKGPYVRISMSDTGSGMSKEIKERIFEPFFTTKEIGKGTGLGLASVYGCVKQHNGYIIVESRVGVGTRFDLYFPIAQSGSSADHKQEAALMPGKGSLLVVDDEPIFHTILTDIFKPLGYTLHCCLNGIEAEEYYRANNTTVDVVILDMNMPKMSGAQCFGHLKEINPGVRVIIASGYGDSSEREALKKEGVEMFIQKPYRASELCEKITELMADAS